jgi:DNA-binding protein H-NS
MTVSLSDLIAQREVIERKIREAQSAKRTEAIAMMQKLMSEYGLTAADLVAKPSSKTTSGSGKKVAPKYCDPVSGATWTGRGLKPKWLSAAIDGGRSATDFAI